MKTVHVLNIISTSHKVNSVSKKNSFYTSACLYYSTIFPLDESKEEERAKLLTKEEEEVDVMCSWVEAGGFPACPEEEAKGLLAEVSLFPCSPSFLPLFTY